MSGNFYSVIDRSGCVVWMRNAQRVYLLVEEMKTTSARLSCKACRLKARKNKKSLGTSKKKMFPVGNLEY